MFWAFLKSCLLQFDSLVTNINILFWDNVTSIIPYYLFILAFIFLFPSILAISFGAQEIYMYVLNLYFDYGQRLATKDNQSQKSKLKSNKNMYYCIRDQRLLFSNKKKKFELMDVCQFTTNFMHCLVDDQVLKTLMSNQVGEDWNVMFRHQTNTLNHSWKVTLCWFFGMLYRYAILLPNRLILVAISVLCLVFSGILYFIFSNLNIAKYLFRKFMIIFSRLSLTSLGFDVRFHDIENRGSQGIFVANHTTPMDAILLGKFQFVTPIGQKQSGFLGFLQRFLAKGGYIFFDRNEFADRSHVSKVLKKHVDDSSKPPVLIFPEGTCVNNTSVLLFRKGPFEITDKIYPIAIKYDLKYGDAFWDSTSTQFFEYLLLLCTSWCIVCDVYYLPVMYRGENEDVIKFTNRVRSEISKKIKLPELDWDGNCKRQIPKKLKESLQKSYKDSLIINTENNLNKVLKRATSIIGSERIIKDRNISIIKIKEDSILTPRVYSCSELNN